MTLSDHQHNFGKDLSILLTYISSLGIKFTLKELLRPEFMQTHYLMTNRSKTTNSMHLKGCAVDIVLFDDNNLPIFTRDHIYYKKVSKKWKSLNPLNRWGGDFKSFDDSIHFERHC